MNIRPLHPTWNNLIDPDWIQSLDDTPFLSRCRSGTATRAELHCFVRQQCYYSRHFTRYLCALLANVTDDNDRFQLTQNLFEEMGLGAFGDIPHSTIYRNMMTAMGVHLSDEQELAATTRLIATMFECSADINPMVGLAALGLGAEAIVPHVYSQIMVGFQACGETAANLEFFRIHIEGDDDHAVTMRNIIELEIARDPRQARVVRDTARRVITARARFFENITNRNIVPSEGRTHDHVQL